MSHKPYCSVNCEMMKFKQCYLIEDTSKIDSIKFKQCHFMGDTSKKTLSNSSNVTSWGHLKVYCQIPAMSLHGDTSKKTLSNSSNVTSWGHLKVDCQIPVMSLHRGYLKEDSIKFKQCHFMGTP